MSFIEGLEDRALLSTLTITGTSGANYVALSQSGTTFTLKNEGSTTFTYRIGSGSTATISPNQTRSLTGVTSVNADAKEGNDRVQANNTLQVRMTVQGGAGNDLIRGGGFSDRLFGDPSTNTTSYADTIYGNRGNDTIEGGAGQDRLFGDEGDTSLSSDGGDSMLGGSGNDFLDGDGGRDVMRGDSGDDTFDVFDGRSDTVAGGSGSNDAAVNVAPAEGDVIGTDVERRAPAFATGSYRGSFLLVVGGPGDDVISFSFVSSTGKYRVTLNGASRDYSLDELEAIDEDPNDPDSGEQFVGFAAFGMGGNDRITSTVTGKEHEFYGEVDPFDGDWDLIGTAGNDTLSAAGAGDVLWGQGGNDSLTVGGTDGDNGDFLDGGAGNDTLTSSTSVTSSNTPSLFGGTGNDRITYTGSDRAALFGGSGHDSLRGGSGIDDLVGDGDNGADTSAGSDGNDTLDGGLGSDTLVGGGGNDVFFGGEADPRNDGSDGDAFIGGSGLDTVDYTNRSVRVVSTPGSATPNDGESGELDDVRSDVETVRGGAGSDFLVGGSGPNLFVGGAGNDTLVGGDGNDTLRGDSGNDSLRAEGGNDLLDGGIGSDTLSGGLGGSDTADYSVRSIGVNVDLDGSAGDDGSTSDFSSATGRRDTLLDIENLTGGSGSDTLTGNDGPNSLAGNGGSDRLVGLGGNDTLRGGTGNDTLTGGGGFDAFFGDDGNDDLFARDLLGELLTGGAGTDRAQRDPNDTLSSVEGTIA